MGDKWWKVAETSTDTYSTMKTRRCRSFRIPTRPFIRFDKPIIFSEVAFCSADGSTMQKYGVYSREIDDFLPEDTSVASDWQEQADAYEAVLQAIAGTSWVQGTYSFGYSFMDHDCKGSGIRAKTAEEVLKLLYTRFNAFS
ncbi:MAG: hypothetical protein ACP5PX_03095 [Candidatus Hadarchaeum sp.]|uniref:hypothetical protein n=1 Tax=Candidatus Hadarchaeum sp. TaxID=2883567 RepID=UPI003D0B1ACE